MLLLFTTIVLLFLSVTAQEEPIVLKQPKAKMPKDSETVGVVGDITIQVTLDKTGKVQSADFVAGPGYACPTVTNQIVLAARDAAKEAAMKAKFKPLAASATAVVATLNYPFGGPVVPSKPGEGVRLYRMDPPRIIGSSEGEASSRGALNQNAISLPKPPYPAAARAIRAGGAIEMKVLIDIDGTILSAEPVSGHPLLQQAARTAACGAKFTPTHLDGKPVKVSGIIKYNFVP
jgi:hypothetical protein